MQAAAVLKHCKHSTDHRRKPLQCLHSEARCLVTQTAVATPPLPQPPPSAPENSPSSTKCAWASQPSCAQRHPAPLYPPSKHVTRLCSAFSSFLGIWIYIGFAYTKATGIRSFSESNPAALFWVCFFILLQSTTSLVCMWKQWFESRTTLFYQGAFQRRVSLQNPSLSSPPPQPSTSSCLSSASARNTPRLLSSHLHVRSRQQRHSPLQLPVH